MTADGPTPNFMDDAAPTTTPQGDDPPRVGRPRRVASALTAAAGVSLVLLTLAGFAGRAAWWLDLTNHFRLHFALGLLVVALLQLLLRPRWLAGAWLAGAAVAGATLWPLWFASLPPAATGDRVTVVHANTGGDSVDAAALAAWVKAEAADWVSLQEVTAKNMPRIAAKLPEYDVVAYAPRADTRGVALLHRHVDGGPAVTAKVVTPTPDSQRPMVSFTFDLAGRPVSVLGFHTTRPAPANNWHWQRQGIDAAVVWAAAGQFAGGEAVLIGDFNSTAAGVHVTELCRRANLTDARRSHGLCGTWPSDLPSFLRVGIDDAYHTGGLVCTKFTVGPYIGSDHRPIAVTLALAK